MLINSAQRMPSIGRRISIEVGDLARRLRLFLTLGCRTNNFTNLNGSDNKLTK